MKLPNLRFIVLLGRRVFVIIWGKFVFCLRPLECMIFLTKHFLCAHLGLDENVRTGFKITWPSEA